MLVSVARLACFYCWKRASLPFSPPLGLDNYLRIWRKKIPATIITGFLGAGKTTLIRHLLQNAQNRRIALIINEFGDVGVDGAVLAGCADDTCPADEIMELSNGCICCTVADDFIPAMDQILARDPAPDHIIIETSGLALPQTADSCV